MSRDLFALGAKILDDNPIMMLFHGRDAGVMILVKMIAMGERRAAPRRSRFRFDLGGRFSMSHTHVRKLLKAAEELDLVVLTKGGGHFVEVKP